MGKKNKLKKFADIKANPKVIETSLDTPFNEWHNSDFQSEYKGNWSRLFFENNHSLSLELACGKGEYTLGLAQMYPDRNFIGVDIKGNRIWKGATQVLEEQIPNAGFLRTRIELLPLFFGPQEVSEIWITFPDPFLRNSKANRRLTSLPFMDRYKQLLKVNARVHLKTDDPTLYEYTLKLWNSLADYQLIDSNRDIYANELTIPELSIQTYYEKQHLAKGKKIRYLCAEYLP